MASCLDPKETSGTEASQGTYRGDSLRFCAHTFSRLRRIYVHITGSDNSPPVKALDGCGTNAHIVKDEDTKKLSVESQQCHVRFEPMCEKSRQAFLTAQTAAWLLTAKQPRMLTLTMKHSKAPLKWQMQNFYKCFGKLRKRKYYKDRVRGSIYFFQTHVADSDGMWHPHLHVLLDSDYLAQSTIASLWKKITYGSHQVKIKYIYDLDNAARHVARYAATPANLDKLSFKDACELVDAVRGVSLVRTTGTARKFSLRPKKRDDAGKRIRIGSYAMVMALADTDESARVIKHALLTSEPLDDGIDMSHMERAIAGDPERVARAPPPAYLPDFYDHPAA